MIEIYSSWSEGLPQDKKALKILKDSGLIAGIEMLNIDNQIDLVKEADLKVCCHNPGMGSTLNLAKKNFMDVFEEETGQEILKTIKKSDSSVVGFHLGYSAEKIFKMVSFPNVPLFNTLINNRKELLQRIATNVCKVAKLINSYSAKTIAVETLDYSREKEILWEFQKEEAVDHKKDLQKTIDKYGVNAGLHYITDPDFVSDFFKETDKCNTNKRIGFIFDVAHNFISADAKIMANIFSGSIEDYFRTIIEATKERIVELHLTVPEGNDKIGYRDLHYEFNPKDKLSNRIIELTRMVLAHIPTTQICLEIERPKLSPVDHAKRMVRQAEYIIKQLNI